MDRLTIEQFHRDKREDLDLSVLTESLESRADITVADISRPGLILAGFEENFLFERIQILGQTEIWYLSTLSDAERDRAIDRLFKFPIPCIIVAKDLDIPERAIELGNRNQIPILRTSKSTTPFIHQLTAYLDVIFAPQAVVHGSLVDVYGVGLMFTGRSAIGKSECALDLVERGHRLVADDVVTITRRHDDILIGSGNDVLRHHMEIRGLGIIDVQSIFGIRAIRIQKRVEVEVSLKEWDAHEDYERVGLEERETTVLGVRIPLVTIPIFPGKNITVIAETVALNYL
ncbi:MAG TPA: HPr(Ser) kinase/phosphatase, partial [Candidatus Udaeobacter sp.]|nr:HPr(Ser) kinase/phosphatase [Candidatus Udaeobacter sp.]